LRPHVTQLFFLPNPVLSVALLAAIGMPLAMTHELAHWLGARINGVLARITISRGYYMLVAQTDLSALWAVPRRRRFPPLLAGIAWDTVRLSGLDRRPGRTAGRLVASGPVRRTAHRRPHRHPRLVDLLAVLRRPDQGPSCDSQVLGGAGLGHRHPGARRHASVELPA
jgi:hypothetical protein